MFRALRAGPSQPANWRMDFNSETVTSYSGLQN